MSKQYNVTITVSLDPATAMEPRSSIKLQGQGWELNVHLDSREISRLLEVAQCSWQKRRALRIGKSGSSDVFWSVDNGEPAILVGHDDETWDFGVFVPQSVLDMIIAEYPQHELIAS
jgi:hypothetical protein